MVDDLRSMGGLFRKKVEETATWGKKKVDESKKAVLENQAGEAAIVEFRKRMDKVNIVTKPSASRKKRTTSDRCIFSTKKGRREFAQMYVIDGVEGYSPSSFLSAVKNAVVRVFDEHKQIKVKMVLSCNMARTNLSTGETIHTKAPFASRIHEILEGSDINGLSNTMVGRILENLATFQSRGSGWQFMSVFDLTIHTVEYKPLRGNRYIPRPAV